ncbi:MAG: FUSC family protein [Streptosporangiaceae bacterium]
MRALVVPDWLVEVVRPKPAPLPWPEMVRTALAICVPLSAAFAVGKGTDGVLPAIGGLLGAMTDTGGTYLARARRVGAAGVFGGAVGLAVGSVIHGHGWIAVLALVVVAGASGVLSSIGDLGSVIGLQLLVYASLGLSPIGALRPVWHTAAGFLAGVLWALILIVPGWLINPHGKEQRDVAAVYRAIADRLRAIGTERSAATLQPLGAALNTAYDEVLAGRARETGRNREILRLVAELNASHLMAESSSALDVAGSRPPPMVISTVERLADAIAEGTPAPVIPPAWDHGAGALALRDSMVGLARVISGEEMPDGGGRRPLRDRLSGLLPGPEQLGEMAERPLGWVMQALAGRLSRIWTLRLMACVGVAAVVSEVLPLQRSYWVLLTVAIVFKPDYGSVLARALQRGIGTIVGAVAGAVILALIHGTWLLIPLAVLAALLPYGRQRNYGLLATFLTPLVVVLVDLFNPIGWRLAEDRLVDTLIGCGIVLVVGFAPWPMSWHAHLPQQFGQTVLKVSDYLEEALLGPAGEASSVALPKRSQMRRATWRALADLSTEFQRTLSEPPSISRIATAWFPAVVALERVMEAITSTAISVSRGATVPPDGVRQLAAALRAVAGSAVSGVPLAAPPELPDDEVLKILTLTTQALLGVIGSGQQVGVRG